MNTRKTSLCLVVILIAFFSVSLMGQAGYGKGRMGGQVLDESGTPLANVKVKIEYPKFGRVSEAVTDAKGAWSFANLSTGEMHISFVLEGYLSDKYRVSVSQVNVNPPHKAVMVVDPSIKARADAEKAYEESVKALETGNQLMKDRKFDEALAFFTEFAQKNPDVIMIQFNIAEIHREKKDFDQAKLVYQKILDFAKEKADVALQGKAISSFGELALRQGNIKEAQGFFEQSIALNPTDEILAYNVAEIYFGSNDTEKAIEYYNKAIQIKPSWSEPYMKIGYAYLNKGEIAKAVQSFEAFLKIEPADSEQAAIAQEMIKSLK